MGENKQENPIIINWERNSTGDFNLGINLCRQAYRDSETNKYIYREIYILLSLGWWQFALGYCY